MSNQNILSFEVMLSGVTVMVYNGERSHIRAFLFVFPMSKKIEQYIY